MKSFFLDSGAYSAYTKNATIDIDQYIAYIKKNMQYIDYYANLDVIDNPEKTYQNQKYLEKNGLKPLPVFHAITKNTEWLKKYIDEGYDYICLGGIAGGAITKEKLISILDILFTNYICDTNGYPKIKTHGFGITFHKALLRYPWYSVDSAAMTLRGAFGMIMMPHFKNGKYDYLAGQQNIIISLQNLKIKHFGLHFINMSKEKQNIIKKYVDSMGFDVEKLKNDNEQRKIFNIAYFQELQKKIPSYPRKFDYKNIRGLF